MTTTPPPKARGTGDVALTGAACGIDVPDGQDKPESGPDKEDEA